MVRVLILENHELVRHALEARLGDAPGLEVVRSSGAYDHAAQQARALHPEVVLLEVKAATGLEALRQLRRAAPSAAVVVLTSYPDSREEAQVLSLGASAYLLKSLDTQALVRQIQAAAGRKQDYWSSLNP
jgi:DNA-binding NarL/FixJ family response regulator